MGDDWHPCRSGFVQHSLERSVWILENSSLLSNSTLGTLGMVASGISISADHGADYVYLGLVATSLAGINPISGGWLVNNAPRPFVAVEIRPEWRIAVR